ncbi:MAG: hypothetical protein Q8N76_06390 [Candidatus Omnitrophota bacterium]|nr:hypothetical protein [Candidatus Omnitrophota bacterium]
MKKLIAIVISLIFIFESTGYCHSAATLRPAMVLSNEAMRQAARERFAQKVMTDLGIKDLNSDHIRGVLTETYLKRHQLFLSSRFMSLDYASDSELYEPFIMKQRAKRRLKSVKQYVLTYAMELYGAGTPKYIRALHWIRRLEERFKTDKKHADENKRKFRHKFVDYLTGKAGPHMDRSGKKKSYSPLEWAARGMFFEQIHEQRKGLLFGKYNIAGLDAGELRIFPVDENGRLREDLIQWMFTEKDPPPIEYYNLRVKKVSLRELLGAFEQRSLDLEDIRAETQSQPFRFPSYIWKIFKTKLEALEPEYSGVTEIISKSGLSWIEWTGEVQWIDDALMEKYGKEQKHLGYKAVYDVWMAAKDAVNEANGYQKGDTRYLIYGFQVKVVIGHHEDIHALLKTETFKDLIAGFRKRLEGAFNRKFTENHNFIQAIKAIYGGPHTSEVSDTVNWYLEEFLTLCIQEQILFNKDARKMFQRLGVENNRAIEITQDTITNVREKAKIKDYQKERDRFIVAVMLMEHGGPLNIKGFLTAYVRTSLYHFLLRKNIIIDDAVRERINELVSRIPKLGEGYTRLFRQAEEMRYKVHDQRQNLLGFEQNYKDFLKELETFFIDFTVLFKNELSNYQDMEGLKPSDKEYITNTITQIEESTLQAISALQGFLTPESGIYKEPISLATWLKRIYRTKVTGIPAAISDVPIIVKGNVQPLIEASPELLHLAIERIISNGFHEITKTGDITKDKVEIELDSKDGHVFITIVSPGHISQEYLKKNPRTGLPNILSLNYLRPDLGHGIALSFVTEAIMKMGGTLEVRNREGTKSPKVEFIIKFPAIKPLTVIRNVQSGSSL